MRSLLLAEGNSVSFDSGDSDGDILLVVEVLLAKELHQITLFFVDSVLKESEGNNCISEEAKGVAEDYLGTHRPKGPAEVPGMSD